MVDQWQVNGTPETLTSPSSPLEITDLSDKKFNEVLSGNFPSTDAFQDFTFNSSTASVYATRKSINGATPDITTTNAALVDLRFNATDSYLQVINSCWISGQEKLAISHMVSSGVAGAGNAPDRGEYVFKYVPADLTNNITGVKLDKGTKTNYDTDSNISAFGTD
jgi:hypothetical protein